MDALSKMTPGALFLMFLSIVMGSSPEIWAKILVASRTIFNFLALQQAPILISINFLFLVSVVSLIAALSFIIERLWDFVFFSALKGYNRKEYELVKDNLISKLPENSEYMKDIKEMNVQPIYGQFLHSYARQNFVNWLGRRWDTYHESCSYTLGMILAIILGLLYILINKFHFSKITYIIIFLGFILSIILISIGFARRNELLMSEKLFCISITDHDVAKAFEEISEIILRRNKEAEKSEPSELSKRL